MIPRSHDNSFKRTKVKKNFWTIFYLILYDLNVHSSTEVASEKHMYSIDRLGSVCGNS
jgi:hypothetical protein